MFPQPEKKAKQSLKPKGESWSQAIEFGFRVDVLFLPMVRKFGT